MSLALGKNHAHDGDDSHCVNCHLWDCDVAAVVAFLGGACGCSCDCGVDYVPVVVVEIVAVVVVAVVVVVVAVVVVHVAVVVVRSGSCDFRS